jgi:hypothetical protein
MRSAQEAVVRPKPMVLNAPEARQRTAEWYPIIFDGVDRCRTAWEQIRRCETVS